MEIILLLGAGLIAGSLNALAGGGSFIAFPALLLAGVPPVLANATNTFAAWPGYISGAIGYWPKIKENRQRLLPYIAAAIIGGYLGAELLLQVDDEAFTVIIPWLMGVAVILFALGGRVSEWLAKRSNKDKSRNRIATASMLVLLAIICLYGGFFNAGLGIILLAFLAMAGMDDIHAMNGVKLTLSSVVATIAVVRFAISGSIAWYEGSLVFAGSLVGGFVAARLAQKIPSIYIRVGIIIYGVILTAVFFWQAYG